MKIYRPGAIAISFTKAMVVLAVFLLAGCSGSEPPSVKIASSPDELATLSLGDPVLVGDGRSPFETRCGKLSDGYTFKRHTETDPRMAVDPTDPLNLVIGFMRDPILAVSAAHSIDGGSSWQEVEPPALSPCTGSDYNAYGDQDIDADASGRFYLVSTQGDYTPEGFPMDPSKDAWMNSALVASVSEDGGSSWSHPVALSPTGEYQHTALVVADKQRAGYATAIWAVAENPSVLEHMQPHLEDNLVYAAHTRDGGMTWSAPEPVMPGFGALDLVQFSDGELLAVGPGTGDKMTFALSGQLKTSRAVSWEPSRTVSVVKGPAWNAAVGTTPSGAIGVFWYDSRDDIPGDGVISVHARFAVSIDQGEHWTETALSEPFDLARGPAPHVMLYLGNYFEDKAMGDSSFAVAYTVGPPLAVAGQSDIHFRRIDVAD